MSISNVETRFTNIVYLNKSGKGVLYNSIPNKIEILIDRSLLQQSEYSIGTVFSYTFYNMSFA